MKKLQLLCLISIITNLVLGTFFIYQQITPLTTTPAHNKQFKVAIMQPVSHPALDEIAQGFMETLQKNNKVFYEFTNYNGNGNYSLIRSQAEEAAQTNYDLIFTIGTGCSKTIKEVTGKKQINKPIVFCAVDDPVGNHLVNSLSSSGNNVTGVTVLNNYQKQIDTLLQVKPTIRKALLVYDPAAGSGMEKYKNLVQKIFADKGIDMQSVEIFQSSEILQKSATFIPHVDVVMVLTDNTVVSGIDSLVKLCNQHGILLFASDLNSGIKGAALAYGVREYETGVESAQKAQLILEKNQTPASIPITPNDAYKIMINRKTMVQQRLKVDNLTLLMATIGEVV